MYNAQIADIQALAQNYNIRAAQWQAYSFDIQGAGQQYLVQQSQALARGQEQLGVGVTYGILAQNQQAQGARLAYQGAMYNASAANQMAAGAGYRSLGAVNAAQGNYLAQQGVDWASAGVRIEQRAAQQMVGAYYQQAMTPWWQAQAALAQGNAAHQAGEDSYWASLISGIAGGVGALGRGAVQYGGSMFTSTETAFESVDPYWDTFGVGGANQSPWGY
jgi:hypothetical protein